MQNLGASSLERFVAALLGFFFAVFIVICFRHLGGPVENPVVIRQELRDDFHLLLGFLNDEKTEDRTAAIVCVSYVEDYLGRVVQTRLPGLNSELKKKMFGPDGMLGPLAAKVSLARALGLIDGETQNNLTVLASIRNKFAHRLEVHNFTHPEITDRLNRLVEVKVPGVTIAFEEGYATFRNKAPPRELFTSTSVMLCQFLLSFVITVENEALRLQALLEKTAAQSGDA